MIMPSPKMSSKTLSTLVLLWFIIMGLTVTDVFDVNVAQYHHDNFDTYTQDNMCAITKSFNKLR